MHGRSIVARIAWLIGAILSLMYVLSLNWMIGMEGFPDGYITESDLAARPYKNVCLVVQALCGFYFGYLSLSPRQKVPSYLAALSVAIAILMVLSMEVVIPWYFVSYLNLKDGRGG